MNFDAAEAALEGDVRFLVDELIRNQGDSDVREVA
jgi:hypothetical protein